MNKKIILLSFLFTSNMVFADSKENIKSYNCEKILFQDLCQKYKNNMEVYKERKKNFKNNRVKYFFNPSSLIDGFILPQPYSKLMDEVFSALDKENISKGTISIANKMKKTLEENFNKSVQKKFNLQDIEKHNINTQEFVEDYNLEYSNFKEKVEIFNQITRDFNNIEKYKVSYGKIKPVTENYLENDLNKKGFIEKLSVLAKSNKISCLTVKYEYIKLDIEKDLYSLNCDMLQ